MKVGLTYDLKTDYTFKDTDPQDANAEFDHPGTIDVIADAFRKGGYEVEKIGNVNSLLARLNNLDVDIVFNITEGLSGRNRATQSSSASVAIRASQMPVVCPASRSAPSI